MLVNYVFYHYKTYSSNLVAFLTNYSITGVKETLLSSSKKWKWIDIISKKKLFFGLDKPKTKYLDVYEKISI